MSSPTSAERGVEVRGRLLAAAAELIPLLGWRGVSTRVVAQKAGVAPGLVHYHFDSVQSLLRQAAVGVMGQVLAAVPPVLSGAESGEKAMGQLLASFEDFDGTDSTSLLFVEAYLAATRDSQLRAELSRILEEARLALTAWLDAQGTPAPAATAAVLIATLDGVMLHRAVQPAMTTGEIGPVLHRLLGNPGNGKEEAGSERR
ncbi:TetR/AcrR family transcriptional regulator [Arthrobacter zhaoguopingii]|uniref:TetR/AcrR family transcriptional regulator n=1 Tax=Arthrobacter zhaoguopingii TaxID=2681491 RepID=UPI00135AC196|nr:TetR/AcrR family transcriptional regulator [Arthrobacter zhaoguopingii]